MTSVCDNKSVGVIVKNLKGNMLLIERARFPFALAPPAGHIDDHGSSLDAAVQEVFEEVGISLGKEGLVHVVKNRCIENRCRRGGAFHDWDVYEATIASNVFTPSSEETSGARWYTPVQLRRLAGKTRRHANVGQRSDLLEAVWLDFFSELDLV